MKKNILIILGIVLITGSTQAQKGNSGPASKAVYGELGGSGLLFSANFDSRFKGHNGLGFRIGIGGAGGTGSFIATFPLGLNYLAGKGPHYFEAGASAALVTSDFSIGDDTGSGWFFMPHFGYRYTKPTKSFNGRIYVGPFIAGGVFFFPFAGLSVGYTL